MRKDEKSYDMFEDTKWSNQKRKSKHRQTKKVKMPNNDQQNTTQKTKDHATRTPLNTGGLGLLFLLDITTA
jgi:hypothetical protein